MKRQIKRTLENLFDENFKFIKGSSVKDMFDELIENNEEVFDLNTGAMGSLYNEEDILLFKRAKKNSKLNAAFLRARSRLEDYGNLVSVFRKDIHDTLAVIREQVIRENNGLKNQIIFLEYDYEPKVCFCGFGEGDYPILEAPQYIKFNSKDELYNGIGSVDFSEFWKPLLEFDVLLEEMGLDDLVWESDIYSKLRYSFKYKTFLLLFEAFDSISLRAFEGIPVQTPLYIYGNEHDAEAINIYVYE